MRERINRPVDMVLTAADQKKGTAGYAEVHAHGDGSLTRKTADFNYPENVRFECTRCVLCCCDTGDRKRRIVMLREEARAIAKATGKLVSTFAVSIRNHAPYAYAVKKTYGRCSFLQGTECTVYSVRPLVCRFYPFELTTADGRYVFHCTLECPGIGRGPRLGSRYYLRLLREAYRRLGNPDELREG